MEIAVLNRIAMLKNPFLDWLMSVITSLGNGGAFWILLTVLFLSVKRFRRWGVAMAIALAVGFLVGNVFLKPLFARVRPFDALEGIELLIRAPRDFSFPSGHALSSFAAASALFFWNRKWGGWALVLASLIAFSRLYLYVHYPSDVLGGILLGIGAGYLGYRISRK